MLVKKNINGFVRTCNYCLADNVKASFHPKQSKSEMVCLFSCLPLAWFAFKPRLIIRGEKKKLRKQKKITEKTEP
jgi:hypothetical protein